MRSTAMEKFTIENVEALPVQKHGLEAVAHHEAVAQALDSGHPSLIRFAPGSEPRDEAVDTVGVAIVPGLRNGKVHARASRLQGNEAVENWSADHSYSNWESQYMIAVVDKRRRVAKIVEPAAEFCFRRITKTLTVQRSTDGTDIDGNPKSYLQRRGELLGTFGSKKAQKKQEKRSMAAITDERVSADAAQQVAMAIGSHAENISRERSSQSTTEVLAPPHDSTASTPRDAYPLHGLMSAIEFGHLRRQANEFLQNPVNSNPGWHDLAWSFMEQTSKLSEDDVSVDDPGGDRTSRVMAAMYLHFLIVLNEEGNMIGPREAEQLLEKTDAPEDVLDSFLSRFTETSNKGPSSKLTRSQRRFRSESLQSKLHYYACVLWLAACGFEATGSLSAFAAALKIDRSQVLFMTSHIGAKARRSKADKADEHAKGTLRIILPTPLVFPELRKRGRKSERR